MVAGAILVVLGFIGFAFRQNRNVEPGHEPTEMEGEELNDEDQAPASVKHRQRD
jgi:hypothetical protein